MEKTMRHVMYYGPGDTRLEECKVPSPASGQVLVKVKACSICGTDLHIMDGKFPLVQPPKDIGHEYSGTVVEVGAGVTSLKVGDLVVGGANTSCGHCRYCRDGQENFCEAPIWASGGFADYMCADASVLFPLPPGASLEKASVVEPIACCLHGLELAHITPGDTVVVCGGGFIGLTLAQLARIDGAGKVILSELDEYRRKVGKAVGCDVVVDPVKQDLHKVVMDLTGGRGADVAIDAVGHPAAFDAAIGVAGRGARVIIFGCADPAARVSISLYDVYFRELKIIGVMASRYGMQQASRLFERLRLDPLLTHRFSLAEFDKAIAAARSRVGMKVLVCP